MKVYFYDCGIRNAVINNFKPLSDRTDTGALWENLAIVERMKFLRYHEMDAAHYFWRTTQQQEIDLIEEGKELKAIEFKWSKTKKPRIPQTFTENYPKAKTLIISLENIESFVTSIQT